MHHVGIHPNRTPKVHKYRLQGWGLARESAGKYNKMHHIQTDDPICTHSLRRDIIGTCVQKGILTVATGLLHLQLSHIGTYLIRYILAHLFVQSIWVELLVPFDEAVDTNIQRSGWLVAQLFSRKRYIG